MSIMDVEASPPSDLLRRWLETAGATLPEIARAIVTRIRAEVPEYADDPQGVVATDTRQAVREALHMFVDSVTRGEPPRDDAGVFHRLGRQEARAGRSHDTLQRAYRWASQAVMVQLRIWEDEHDSPPVVIGTLESAVFEFIERLATFSAEGFAEAHAGVDDEHARNELIALLVRRDRFSRRAVAEAAERAGWPLPETVTVVEVVDQDHALQRVFGRDVVRGRVGDRCMAIAAGTPDLAALRTRLRESGSKSLLVVGQAVRLPEASSAARLVHQLRALHDVRRRAVDGVAVCDKHMVDLMLDAGRHGARVLVSTRLEPLAQLSLPKRVTYGQLLSAWLEYGSLHGDEPGVLDKHRQTLRYRRAKLQTMFGDALTDRDARVELLLALRAQLPLWERQAAREEGESDE